jgi:hypothetical protein
MVKGCSAENPVTSGYWHVSSNAAAHQQPHKGGQSQSRGDEKWKRQLEN